MKKDILFILVFSLLAVNLSVLTGYSKEISLNTIAKDNKINSRGILLADTTVPADVMTVITAVINSTNKFNIEDVANLYTPNAVVADDEPPYSWNGPTAGIQWVNAVEKTCKDNKLTKLKATIEPINIFQQTGDNTYIVVPVSYTGELPGKVRFSAKGAFTFVLRMEDGKWLIKSQAWMPKKGT